MARGSSVSRILAQNATLATGQVGGIQSLLGADGFSVTIRQSPGTTGTIAGAFKLQATDFGGDTPPGVPPVAGDWWDVPSATVTWAGVTVGLSVATLRAKFVRVVFTDAGSAGDPQADIAISVQCWSI